MSVDPKNVLFSLPLLLSVRDSDVTKVGTGKIADWPPVVELFMIFKRNLVF